MPKKIITTVAISLLVLVALGGLFFFIKGKIETAQKNRPEEKPSITSLATLPPKNEEPQPAAETPENENKEEESTGKETEEVKNEETVPANNTTSNTEVLVLNGGAAIGSAGKVQKLLEDGGYKKVTAANALADNHVGQMIYYKPAAKADAEAIKKLTQKTYPEIEIQEGKTTEQTKKDVVVMLGK